MIGQAYRDGSLKTVQQDRCDAPDWPAGPPDVGRAGIAVAVLPDIHTQRQPAQPVRKRQRPAQEGD